ncbi:hypothetical protein MYX65_00585 [Acidobacteria bacterium AH-259-L09]|nr:hypothetical protein [Acidobacteria bacterium AH-259-L09]
MKGKLPAVAVVLLLTVGLQAHPHFQKSVIMKLGDVEAKVVFTTLPANEEHVANVTVGEFNVGFARLTLSGDITAGDVTIPAGEYSIGAIKNGDNDWTLAVHPRLGRGETADMSKVIKLDSMYSASQGKSAHIVFDVAPGHGKLEGRAVLVWHFGSHYLAGALS